MILNAVLDDAVVARFIHLVVQVKEPGPLVVIYPARMLNVTVKILARFFSLAVGYGSDHGNFIRDKLFEVHRGIR